MIRYAAVLMLMSLLAVGHARGEPLSPEDAETLRLAQQQFDQRAFRQAVTLLRRFIVEHPDEGEAHRLLGHCYYELGRTKEARRAFVASIERGRMTADLLVRLVQIDREAGRVTEELGSLRALLMLDPADGTTRLLYADALLRAGAGNQATSELRHVLNDDPLNIDARLRLANLLMERGEHAAAAVMFQSAFHLGAKRPAIAQTIAELWVDMNDAQEALRWYNVASQGDRIASPRSLRRAELLIAVGDFDRALEVLRPIASSADKKRATQAELMLGRIAHQRGDVEATVAHWTRAIDNGANDTQLLAYLGAFHFNNKRYDVAARYLHAQVASDAETPATHRFLVISRLRSGDTTGARSEILRYVERYGFDEVAESMIAKLNASDRGDR